MGQEIVYCSKCQTRLRGSDFESRKAYRIGPAVCCAKCAPDVLHTLPPEAVKDFLDQATSPQKERERAQPVASPLPRAAEPGGDKITARKQGPDAAPKRVGTSVWFGGLGVIGLALILALVASRPRERGESSRAPSSGTAPAPAGPVEIPKALPGGTAAAPERPPNPDPARNSEAEAIESLRRAREFAKSNPDDLPGQMAQYERAVWISAGGKQAEPAKLELEAIKKKDLELATKELPALMEQFRSALGKEEFARAGTQLQQARKRHASTEWSDPIDLAVKEARATADKMFAELKEKALGAKQKGADEELQKIKDRIATWGLEDLARDLESSLSRAGAPPPAPPPVKPAPKEPGAYRAGWDRAMERASSRNYGAALEGLTQLAKETEDPGLRSELANDSELLRAVGELVDKVREGIAKWPKDQKLAVSVRDENGRLLRVEGHLARADAFRLELRRELGPFVVERGEIAAASLAEIYTGRLQRKSKADQRLAGVLCLLEGEAEEATKLIGEDRSVPERLWAYAGRVAGPTANRESSEKEQAARKLFYATERDYYDYSKTLSCMRQYGALLSDYAQTSFVRRNRDSIANRMDSVKEFGLVAEDLAARGEFRIRKGVLQTSWTSEKEVGPDQERDNFIEAHFAVLPDADYRCWVYAGGCCQETFSFSYQVNELTGPDPRNPDETVAMEPGGPYAMPGKPPSGASAKKHAQHGGPKGPARWEWIPVPFPKFGTPGPKTLRLVTRQQGFSVAGILISSTRQAPPKDLRATEDSTIKPVRPGPEGSLVLHWKADEGKGRQILDSSANGIGGTFSDSGPLWSKGLRGGALLFDGSRDFVTPWKAFPDIKNSFTMTLWVKPAATRSATPEASSGAFDGQKGQRYALFPTHGRQYGPDHVGTGLSVGTNGISVIEHADQHMPSTLVYEGDLSGWSFVCLVYSDRQPTLYVNGAAVRKGKVSAMTVHPSAHLGGARGLDCFYCGLISDVRIYNRALTDTEIQALAASK
jgi:hypothetical protein